MPRTTFSTEHGDYGEGESERGEFLRRLGALARSYGYYVHKVEVESWEQRRDQTRWMNERR